ncbi:TIGR02597 family protein [Puniceicoccaceae bacterium K14]|nr:TIGR02597 family protein [Puniceicoccaceae bacterium K14]
MPKSKCVITRITAAAIALTPLVSQVSAEEVYSQIVGAIALEIPQESDVVVSFPFKQSTLYAGVASSSTLGSGTLTIGVDSTLTASEFATGSGDFPHSHYLSIESGALKGRTFSIVSNASDSITVDISDDDSISANDVATDDLISIAEFWTLGSAFPSGVGSVEESEPGLRNIEFILPSSSSNAESMNAEGVYFFSDGAWRQLGKPLSYIADDLALAPQRAFVIRNNSDETLKSYFFGEVSDAPLAIPLAVDENDDIDSFVGIGRPLDVEIQDLGLESSGVFVETTNANDIQDRVLVYSLDATGKNKKPVGEYYYYNSAWRKVGSDVNADLGSDIVEANMALAVRKANLGTAPTSSYQYWVNEWSLPQ